MANATGADTKFSGDEFSNNLFSDLAPLLTLFGEQVTKQFLSMSLGWADNILLGMGPLGIMTIIVSAIRVGGVRQLKALVGRARESQSTAEQELLSSTSPDVCELWSGKEIVRMIGSPAGMKTLIVTKSSDDTLSVLDLASAFESGLLSSQSLPVGDAATAKLLSELSEAAPNLALNVKNATAPAWELWLYASVGVVLQTTAMAVPFLSTYFWQWDKGGAPVPQYGYPCFLIGTLLVILGVIACGHVIEGITTEHYFSAEAKDGVVVDKIVRLQRPCTVSDQHFTAFAIYNREDDSEIRFSRLNKPDERNYSTLAATATFAAVVGFIVQFIGLRALHWSATVIQLGVTLIMTGIRAYVRRGLATNPICSPLLDRHETDALTLKLFQDQAALLSTDPLRPTGAPKASRRWACGFRQLFRLAPKVPIDQFDNGSEHALHPFTQAPSVCAWEVPTLRYHKPYLDNQYGVHPDLAENSRARLHWQGPWKYSSHWRSERPMSDGQLDTLWNYDKLYGLFFSSVVHALDKPLGIQEPPYPVKGYPDAKEPELHAQIRALMPELRHEVTDLAHKLTMAIELVMAECWSEPLENLEFKSGRKPFGSFQWLIPVAFQRLWEAKTIAAVRMEMTSKEPDLEGGETEAPPRWSLQTPGLLESVLSLWMYTLAEGRNLINNIHDFRQELGLHSTGLGSERPWAHGKAHARVVGHTAGEFTEQTWLSSSSNKDPEDASQLQNYLGKNVLTVPSVSGMFMLDPNWESEMSLPASHGLPVFGIFLSCLSSAETLHQGGGDHYIYTRPNTRLATHCAQEIFSIFMLALAAEIERVGGETVRRPPTGSTLDKTRAPRTMENSVFRDIAQQVIKAGMVHDITEAYTLVIPAFAHYNLLPTATNLQDEALTNADGEDGNVEETGVVGNSPEVEGE